MSHKTIDIDWLIGVAEIAGEKILEVYKEDFEVYEKSDQSPLTEADKRANDAITLALSEKYPAIPIISEENKLVSYEERKDWESCWMVDPLDGTKEFVKKNGEFTVNIALIENGTPTLGVVYQPVTGVFYWAVNDQGAFKKSKEGEAMRLPLVSSENSKSVRVVASRSHLSDAVVEYVDGLKADGKEVEFVSIGSSLKLCLVAEGSADVYPRLGPTMEWDTAAAHIVAKEAGKHVRRYGEEAELEYNKEDLLNPWFIVQ